MSPLPNFNDTFALQPSRSVSQHLSKRINLNPLHYLTLPLKTNWDKVAPIIDQYNVYTRTIAILLGGLSLVVMLDNHKWKLPRWPWAKDGLNNPSPSYVHENEKVTANELAERKLLEVLKEMKMYEGLNEALTENKREKGEEEEDVQQAEEEFMQEAQVGVEDVIQEMQGGDFAAVE
jgi:hypothetical protein